MAAYAVLRGRAQKDVLQLAREKKDKKSRPKKAWRSWNKKLVNYNIKWCHINGTYGHSICAFAI